MPRKKYLFTGALILAAATLAAFGDSINPRELYEKTTPSLVAVQFTFIGETYQQDVIVPGIVVDDHGLVMIPLAAVSESLPDEQLKNFKIIVPKHDNDNIELDAEFQGRDERSEMAFVRAKPAVSDKIKYTWIPIHFESIPTNVGDAVYSVGMLEKSQGYETTLAPGVVAATPHGVLKQVMVAGGSLASPHAPVFNSDGKAIGVVLEVPPASLFLDDTQNKQRNQPQRLLAEIATNRYFLPTSEFAISLKSPPSIDHPVPLAWAGLPELSGLGKNEAAIFNLANQPAVQINDVMPDSPAEKAGLKKSDIITRVDGQPIERGDQPEALPAILRRKLVCYKPGDVVTFTIISAKDQPPHDVKVTLAPQPKRANQANRYWSEDIGFGVREMVLLDRYGLKLKRNEKDGVLVTFLKDGSSAASAGLRPNDMITQLNGEAVSGFDSFKSEYEQFREKHEHEAIVLVVHRGSGEDTIRIEPPQ